VGAGRGVAAAQDRVLHAWKAGPQTVELARQLQAMPDGGVFVLTIPRPPIGARPVPTERTCQVAWYLKNNSRSRSSSCSTPTRNITRGPRSSARPGRAIRTSSPRLQQGREGRPGHAEGDDRARRQSEVTTPQPHPARSARDDAVSAYLVGADKRWCEVNHLTYESVKHKNIPRHRRLDDRLAGAEVGQHRQRDGKISALAVVSLLSDKPVPPMGGPGNTCYSWVSRPGGHRGRQRVQDRGRQGRADRAEAHARPVGDLGAERG